MKCGKWESDEKFCTMSGIDANVIGKVVLSTVDFEVDDGKPIEDRAKLVREVLADSPTYVLVYVADARDWPETIKPKGLEEGLRRRRARWLEWSSSIARRRRSCARARSPSRTARASRATNGSNH